MENKLNLDPQTILDKEFHVDFKGYSPAEVDEFLDSVIQGLSGL
nr:DivI1A_domain: DivIVA [uncultured bacterium]